MTIPIERVRALLGPGAEGKTDAQLQHLAEDLGNAASAFYDEVQSAWKHDPESVRWLVHTQRTGEIADAENDYDTVEGDLEQTSSSLSNYLNDTGETE